MKVKGSRPVRTLHSGTSDPFMGVGPGGGRAASRPHTVPFDGFWASALSSLRVPPQQPLLRFRCVAAAAATAVTLSRPLSGSPCFPAPASPCLPAAFRPAALSAPTANRRVSRQSGRWAPRQRPAQLRRKCKARLQMRRWHFPLFDEKN